MTTTAPTSPLEPPAGLVIRRARREETARIAELILLGAARPTMTADEIAAESHDPSYLRAFDAVLASGSSTVFVAELAGEIVGTLQLTLIPGLAARGRLRAKLESVHVAPDQRGLRIGEALVRHAIAAAREAGAGLVELSSDKVRTDAHRFYVRLGFAQSHEAFKLPL